MNSLTLNSGSIAVHHSWLNKAYQTCSLPVRHITVVLHLKTLDSTSPLCWGLFKTAKSPRKSTECKKYLALNISQKGLPWWMNSKESTYNVGAVGDMGSIPGSGRFPGGRHGNPLQYSCLEYSSSVPWKEEPGRLQFIGSQSRIWLNWLSMAQYGIPQKKDTYCSIRAKIRRQSITLFQLNWEHASPAMQSAHVLGWLWKQDEYWFWGYK